jgi:hypothetical protein
MRLTSHAQLLQDPRRAGVPGVQAADDPVHGRSYVAARWLWFALLAAHISASGDSDRSSSAAPSEIGAGGCQARPFPRINSTASRFNRVWSFGTVSDGRSLSVRM